MQKLIDKWKLNKGLLAKKMNMPLKSLQKLVKIPFMDFLKEKASKKNIGMVYMMI